MIKILNGRTMKGVAAGAAFVGMIAFPVAAEPPLPRDVPRHAAEALALAQKWQRDAILIAVQTQENMNFALEFGFRSPSTKGRFAATYANGRMSSEVRPPITANDGGAIPLQFLDLPAALAQARRQGLSSAVKEASLDVTGAPGRPPRLTWSIQADTDHYPYVFTVNANVGAPPANNIAVNDRTHAPAHLSALPVRIVTPSSAAEALWQKANAYYDRKDFPDALSAYMQAAQLGHPRAMAVLGNMYREGEGVPKNLGKAVSWYTQAAARGNRGAQFSLGSMYEEGEGVSKNLGKATQLYEAMGHVGRSDL